MCSTRIFMRSAGIVQIARLGSLRCLNSAQSANRTSPKRTSVRAKNSNPRAVVRLAGARLSATGVALPAELAATGVAAWTKGRLVLANHITSHLGLLHQWTPWLAAVLPSVVYTLMAMSAFVWLVRNR